MHQIRVKRCWMLDSGGLGGGVGLLQPLLHLQGKGVGGFKISAANRGRRLEDCLGNLLHVIGGGASIALDDCAEHEDLPFLSARPVLSLSEKTGKMLRCGMCGAHPVQNPSRKTTRSRSIPGDFDTGKTQDPPRGRHTFCVLGAILRFAQRKNTITYLLFYMPEGQTSIGQSHEFVLLYRAYTTISCVIIGGK